MPSSNPIMKIIAKLLVAVVLTGTGSAAEAPDPTQKIRGQLRSVMLQLRTAQTENANAQAALAAAEQNNKDLAAKLAEVENRNATLAKQAVTDKAAADKTIATLEGRLVDRDKRIGEYSEALEKCKAGYQQADGIARAKDAECTKLAAEIVEHKRTIADREAKNIALFNISNEILKRYENYALGKALTAREPFIGTTRVKVESLVQGYHHQILDNRMRAPKPNPSP